MALSILKAAEYCSCSGRCICQVEQLVEQYFYLESGMYLFQQFLQVSNVPNPPKTLDKA